MTTTIKVTSHNYPARIEIVDSGNVVGVDIKTPEDGESTYHCTTTREIRITDLEYDHPAVLAAKEAKSK